MNNTRRLPAEWEPQDGVLLAWPHADTDWSERLDLVERVYLELVQAIIRYERVVVVTPEPETVEARLTRAGLTTDRVTIAACPTNDTWCRDFGPVTVFEEGEPLLLDFGFNGWGLKFPACHDNLVTARLAARGLLRGKRSIPGLILEGGSIESDGHGLLLTTSHCLLESNRNPHLTRADIEQRLLELLGGRKVLWLDHGYLAGDDTDSHIDTLARLAPGDTILYVRCDDPADEHYRELCAMEEQLRSFTTLSGRPFKLVPLPWPQPVYSDAGGRLPATYANFLVLNRAVLVPTYDDPADDTALQVVAAAFPGRDIIAVACRTLIEQHGSLHCVTMQLPEGVLT